VHILNVLERDGRDEARGLPRLADLAVELVDLLQRQTLGLVDHSPDEEDADEAASAPDEEDLGTEVGVSRAVVDHVGGGVSDGKVKEPVTYQRLALVSCALKILDNLLAVVIERDLARTLRGKISPVTTHATGPQEQAKKKM
jgi:hypothetical protein